MEAVSMLEQNCFNKNNHTEWFENLWKFFDSLEAVEAVLTQKNVRVCCFLNKKGQRLLWGHGWCYKKIFQGIWQVYTWLKKYDSILFLHQPMTSEQPLKIVQRHMAHPVHDRIEWLRKKELEKALACQNFLLFR